MRRYLIAATFAALAGPALAQPTPAPAHPPAAAPAARTPAPATAPIAPATPAATPAPTPTPSGPVRQRLGQQVRTYASTTAPFASTVTVPPGYDTIFVAGRVAAPTTPATATSPAVYGNTEQQTEATIARIEADLRDQGASLGDVVQMTVYLVGVPEQQGRMDFAGMNTAYGRHFGIADQPNRPVRTTVQVAGLAGPGILVEITVIAMRPPAARPN